MANVIIVGMQWGDEGKGKLKFLYPDDMPLWENTILTAARRMTLRVSRSARSGSERLITSRGRWCGGCGCARAVCW